jgi:hypothetical protein
MTPSNQQLRASLDLHLEVLRCMGREGFNRHSGQIEPGFSRTFLSEFAGCKLQTLAKIDRSALKKLKAALANAWHPWRSDCPPYCEFQQNVQWLLLQRDDSRPYAEFKRGILFGKQKSRRAKTPPVLPLESAGNIDCDHDRLGEDA